MIVEWSRTEKLCGGWTAYHFLWYRIKGRQMESSGGKFKQI